MGNMIKRRGSAGRRWITLFCVLALACAVLPARAEDAGGDDLTGWSWDKFFDYAACGLAVGTAIPTGGATIPMAAIACGRALYIHFSD